LGTDRIEKITWSFFSTMSLVIALVVAAGFGPTYSASLAPPGLPLWVHLHGAVMAGWIILFLAQGALVRHRAVSLHRALGAASIGLVVIMGPLGIATDLLAIRRGAVPPFFSPAGMFASDFCDLILFTALFAWALILRRRSDWHKRLLLCATVLLTFPAIARLLPHASIGLDEIVPFSIAILVGLALLGPLHDWLKDRRAHPAYLWGVGLIILVQPLHYLLAESGPVQLFIGEIASTRS